MEPAESRHEEAGDGEQAEHAGHVHGACGEDPHIWLDPLRAAEIVARLGEEFARLDPAHAPAYRSRARAYAEELRELAEEIASTGAPVRGKQVVVFHDAYGYLFDRLGLKVAGVIQLSPGVTPSPRDVAQAVRKMRQIGQRHVFVEAEYQGAARPVAEALGGKVVLLDHLTLREVPWGRTYAERLRYDVKALTENLP
jgi:zinc transport system substrate-binding protein